MAHRRLALAACLTGALSLGGCRFVTGATWSADGTQGNGGVSSGPTVSTNGRYVGFDAEATNLVPGDTNGVSDIFVRDQVAGTMERASFGYDGSQADGASSAPRLSGDGRFVVFKSEATNLVPGDTNGVADVFVVDRQAHTTTRVSVASDGTQANAVSSLYALPTISSDGHVAAYVSVASNLVAGDLNGTADTFVHDLTTGATELVNVASDGTHGNGWAGANISISATGRYVAFPSAATNLVPGDMNGKVDLFVRDRAFPHTSRVSMGYDGRQPDGDSMYLGVWISRDGRFVTFRSLASNLVPGDTNGEADVFVVDRMTGVTDRVSVASGGAQAHGEQWQHISDASISDDGRFVLFDSWQSDLVPDDTNGLPDVFVHDRWTGETDRVSEGPTGTQSNGYNGNSQISADGAWAVFGTTGSNVIPFDRDRDYDIAIAYVALPRVTAFAPATLPRGAAGVSVTVTGSWFRAGAHVSVGPGIHVTDVELIDGRTLRATVAVDADAPTGARTVIVDNKGGGAGPAFGADGRLDAATTVT